MPSMMITFIWDPVGTGVLLMPSPFDAADGNFSNIGKNALFLEHRSIVPSAAKIDRGTTENS